MSYQGWKDWDTWNVALWMYNTEAMYADVVRAVRSSPSLAGAAENFMAMGYEGMKTLDGAAFTLGRVGDALMDDHEEYWSEQDD